MNKDLSSIKSKKASDAMSSPMHGSNKNEGTKEEDNKLNMVDDSHSIQVPI